jgi:hypothetical protein
MRLARSSRFGDRWGLGRAAALVLLCLLCAALAACGPSSAANDRPPAGPDPASSVRLRSAKIEYYRAGPTDPVVEVQIILENGHRRHTDSTTILWDAAFAQNMVFLNSDPPAWRVRTDDRGRGTLDTTGVIPGQYATYKLWFAAGTYAPLEPQLLIVANGNVEVAETVAEASHLAWQVPPASQQAFERGTLATLIGPATSIVPAGGAPGFFIAVALGVALTVLTLSGSVLAFRAAGTPRVRYS